MSLNIGLDRRAFLKSAGMTVLAGAGGAGTASEAAAAGATVRPVRLQRSQFDFDTVYDRIGTDCSKWDRQIAIYGRDNIEVPMGVADQDFKIAPAITRALQERIAHENYGYLSIPVLV